MGVQLNQVRQWAIRRARVYKDLFATALVPKGWLYRWLFGDGKGGINVVGEMVLSDLRGFCHVADPTIFDKDPLVMARKEGRREVFVRIQNFLNLDENAVRHLMEIEDDDNGI
ncbi:hypothetical protein [Novosphingobium guangzhouense]|uniref:Bbp19-like phage domain-containing protein n=1 Tax=Novosphingobium guangzhouense TaxID=1850347 RepID=A0A2K2G447_9SPHN|nr:hypothetical protein [Novosphingobium guangzhouense]PNU05813.1 hypothetical protein A8V01_14705 [Novosphingobium guangzhouense]